MRQPAIILTLIAVMALVYWLVLQLQIPQPFRGLARVGLGGVVAVILLIFLFGRRTGLFG